MVIRRVFSDVDALAGMASILWAVLAVDPDAAGPREALVPQLAALCSAMIAGPFGFAAIARFVARERARTARS